MRASSDGVRPGVLEDREAAGHHDRHALVLDRHVAVVAVALGARARPRRRRARRSSARPGRSCGSGPVSGPQRSPAFTRGSSSTSLRSACAWPRKRSSLSNRERFRRVAVNTTPKITITRRADHPRRPHPARHAASSSPRSRPPRTPSAPAPGPPGSARSPTRRRRRSRRTWRARRRSSTSGIIIRRGEITTPNTSPRPAAASTGSLTRFWKNVGIAAGSSESERWRPEILAPSRPCTAARTAGRR